MAGDDPLRATRGVTGTGPRQGAQEAQRLGGRQLGAQVKPGGDNRRLGETTYPTVRQRNLLLHDPPTARPDREFVGPDGQAERLTASQPPESVPQREVDIDVRGAATDLPTVQSSWGHIQPGVHAATTGKRLEPQPAAPGRHHRIEARGPGPPGIVVPDSRHIGDREQRRRGHLRFSEDPVEEARVRGNPGRGASPARLQG